MGGILFRCELTNERNIIRDVMGRCNGSESTRVIFMDCMAFSCLKESLSPEKSKRPGRLHQKIAIIDGTHEKDYNICHFLVAPYIYTLFSVSYTEI